MPSSTSLARIWSFRSSRRRSYSPGAIGGDEDGEVDCIHAEAVRMRADGGREGLASG
jgi:hypothetical protein